MKRYRFDGRAREKRAHKIKIETRTIWDGKQRNIHPYTDTHCGELIRRIHGTDTSARNWQIIVEIKHLFEMGILLHWHFVESVELFIRFLYVIGSEICMFWLHLVGVPNSRLEPLLDCELGKSTLRLWFWTPHTSVPHSHQLRKTFDGKSKNVPKILSHVKWKKECESKSVCISKCSVADAAASFSFAESSESLRIEWVI